MNLPASFIQDMKQLFRSYGLSSEEEAFFASFDRAACMGLRANTLKTRPEALRLWLADQENLPETGVHPVPWSHDGFYTTPDLQPGRLAAHAAGLYYIQEPSAMLPAAVLKVRPGERVLDLCAAPGGKATRLAADLEDSGLLWANEISRQRVRALQRTLELTGCAQAVITSETPERLAERLPGYFDAVLADAPCSGAGMFRRDPGAVRSYQSYGSEHCLPLQRSILEAAWRMLRPGGRLVYSTCTFSLEENESMVAWFCARHDDCQILPIMKAPGVSDGLMLSEPLRHTARIWPHRCAGDGHFCALLGKSGTDEASPLAVYSSVDEGTSADWQSFLDFVNASLTESGRLRMNSLFRNGIRRLEHDHLHLLPACPAVLSELYKVKTGLFLGTLKRRKGQVVRFEPSQAFLLSLRESDLACTVSGREEDDLIRRYLRGETLQLGTDHDAAGWPSGALATVLLEAAGGRHPLGWASLMTPPNQLKNLYPHGWIRPF
ncbi:MAG: SAM-dependent methyltransferase [Ruminococcaceae bacterium]|nr:SAM-dependent methyltransferase [Oscillospiraceae bacterium]